MSAIGHTAIGRSEPYPPEAHPAGRAFEWSTGRVLPTLQLIAIREGEGEVEWTRELTRLEGSSAFILRPGEWHRYRPDPSTGWTEDWFELRGALVDSWCRAKVFEGRTFHLSDPASFFADMDRLHRDCGRDRHAVPGSLAGRAMALLADVTVERKGRHNPKLRPGQREMIAIARDHFANGTGVNEVAHLLGVSYPTLHRTFKSLTGISPKAYSDQFRMARAEALLGTNRLTVKEIAAELGFNSSNHFSAAFKQQYGLSPRNWLDQILHSSGKLEEE